MKKHLLNLSAILLLSTLSYSQVGINTNDPKSTLDTRRNTNLQLPDGIQPPRVTYTELVEKNNVYAIDQTSSLIYVTEGPAVGVTPVDKVVNVKSTGYYYFDGSVWQKFGLSNNVWNLVSTPNQASMNNERIYHSGKASIGIPQVNLDNSTGNTFIDSFFGQNLNVHENIGIYRLGTPSNLVLTRANGSWNNLSDTSVNDVIGGLLYEGYSHTRGTSSAANGVLGYGRIGASQIQAIATNNFTDRTASAAKMVFFTMQRDNDNLLPRMTISEYGNVGIGIGGISTETPLAKLHVVGATGKDVQPTVRFTSLPTTEDKKNDAARSNVTYDRLTPLMVDNSGNVVKVFDPSAPATSSTFDGVYSVPSILSTDPLTATTGVLITKVNLYSLINFDIYTGLQLGPSGTGSNVLSSISFGLNSGFDHSRTSSGSGAMGTTLYPITVLKEYNGATSSNNLLTSINYNFTNPVNSYSLKIFFVQTSTSPTDVGEIRAVILRNSGMSNTNVNLSIFNSKKFR